MAAPAWTRDRYSVFISLVSLDILGVLALTGYGLLSQMGVVAAPTVLAAGSQFLAQGVHFSIPVIIGMVVFLPIAIWTRYPPWFYGSLLAVLAWAALKEVWFDPWTEGAPFFMNGAIDLAFYALGAVMTAIAGRAVLSMVRRRRKYS